MSVTVVYAINSFHPFGKMAFQSIKTLRKHNRDVFIKIINTGEQLQIPEYCYPCEQLLMQGVFQRFPDDKSLIGTLEDENIIYLDADTFIFDDIEKLFVGHSHKFSARLSWTYQNTNHWFSNYEINWQKNLSIIGSKRVPVFNSGVLIFKEGAHQMLYGAWVQNITRFHQGELLSVYGGERLYEQIALSLSIGLLSVPYCLLSPREHSYAWNDELSDETVVLHTTSKWYDDYWNRYCKDL